MDCHAILQGGAHACARAPPASLGLGAGLGLGLKIDEPSGLRLGVGALLAAAALAAVHAALSAALSLPYRPLAVAALRYVRPRLSTAGPLAIVAGRHPLLEQAQPGITFTPNDTYLSVCSSLALLTGPNMVGKSTYLRQVALIVVLAQVGCFVPAEFAALSPVDRLFTRIGMSDSIETNSSTFMVEMTETAYIVRHATKRSLVIIDELGRATSTAGAPPASACPQNGVAVAWAVCEHLLRLGAATLFATHFGQLAELAARHPTLRLWHFEAAAPGGDARARLAFTHRLLPGGQPGSHYGLALAAAVCVPDQILAEARRISAAVDAAARQHVRGGSSAHGADSAGGGADAGTSAGSGALQGAGPTQGGTASGGCEARRALCSLAHRVACVARAWADSPASVDLAAQLAPLQSEARTVLAAGERAAGGNGGGAGV